MKRDFFVNHESPFSLALVLLLGIVGVEYGGKFPGPGVRKLGSSSQI